jgi:hypothetical protein
VIVSDWLFSWQKGVSMIHSGSSCLATNKAPELWVSGLPPVFKAEDASVSRDGYQKVVPQIGRMLRIRSPASTLQQPIGSSVILPEPRFVNPPSNPRSKALCVKCQIMKSMFFLDCYSRKRGSFGSAQQVFEVSKNV